MRVKAYTSAGDRRFVVFSGLPGSGKTTLARQVAPRLGLQLVDKDDILERLFELKGIGDARWRRALSRESDAILQTEAMASPGSVLTSMWHVPGMAADSGTPTSWLSELSRLVVHVHCACTPELAAERFMQRRRHIGHLDNSATLANVLSGLRSHANRGALDIAPRVNVDTTGEPEIERVVGEIHRAFAELSNDDQAGSGSHVNIVGMSESLRLVPFRSELASAFADLNRAWIERFFTLEAADWKVLRDPGAAIVDPGGQIFFAMNGERAVGTVAAILVTPTRFELAKMAVAPDYQGRGLGQRLGEAAVDFARSAGAKTLFLETNSTLANAIRLYERLGFRRAAPPRRSDYARSDVYMEIAFPVPEGG